MKCHGWKYLAGGVYEHSSSARVHMLGLLRLANKQFVSANEYPQSSEAWKCIQIQGGNRKRGLMLWAARIIQNKSEGLPQ